MFGCVRIAYASCVVWRAQEVFKSLRGVAIRSQQKTMNGHDLGYYVDNYVKIPFCKNCGKEKTELVEFKCTFEKIVDKKKEPGVGSDHC